MSGGQMATSPIEPSRLLHDNYFTLYSSKRPAITFFGTSLYHCPALSICIFEMHRFRRHTDRTYSSSERRKGSGHAPTHACSDDDDACSRVGRYHKSPGLATRGAHQRRRARALLIGAPARVCLLVWTTWTESLLTLLRAHVSHRCPPFVPTPARDDSGIGNAHPASALQASGEESVPFADGIPQTCGTVPMVQQGVHICVNNRLTTLRLRVRPSLCNNPERVCMLLHSSSPDRMVTVDEECGVQNDALTCVARGTRLYPDSAWVWHRTHPWSPGLLII
jgi:hypothetical protein